MNIEQLVETYAALASQHFRYLFAGNSEANNRIVDEMAIIVCQIKKSAGDMSPLKTLLTHQECSVRFCAAGELLRESDREAVQTLESIAKTDDLQGFLAKTVLDEWRSGCLKQS